MDKYSFKIVVIGDQLTGKTYFIKKYTTGAYDKNEKPTIGCNNYIYDTVVNENHVRLNIYDISGDTKYRPLLSCFCRNAHGCIMMYDQNFKLSCENLNGWYEDFNSKVQVDIMSLVLITVGNKSISTKDASGCLDICKTFCMNNYLVNCDHQESVDEAMKKLIILMINAENSMRAKELPKKEMIHFEELPGRLDSIRDLNTQISALKDKINVLEDQINKIKEKEAEEEKRKLEVVFKAKEEAYHTKFISAKNRLRRLIPDCDVLFPDMPSYNVEDRLIKEDYSLEKESTYYSYMEVFRLGDQSPWIL